MNAQQATTYSERGPQLENGYLRIANELFDAILAFDFTKRQQSVLLAIIRKTYGYNKKADDVSASQIAAMIASNRSHVSSALVDLERMNVLFRSPGQYGTLTTINKNYTSWIPPKKAKRACSEQGPLDLSDKAHHYVYRVTLNETGEFYIGVRSCDCLPNQDRYMGSGGWLSCVKKRDMSKEVLASLPTREAAEAFEKQQTRLCAGNRLCRNVMRYKSDSDDACTESGQPLDTDSVQPACTESGHHPVQNSDFSSTESVQVGRTESVHTKDNFPKDNQKTIPIDRFADESNRKKSTKAVTASLHARFDEFWNAFAHKNGKAGALKSWAGLVDRLSANPDASTELDRIIAAAAKEAERRPLLVSQGRTPMFAQGWLSQERFDDEDLAKYGEFTAEQQAFVDVFNDVLGAVLQPVLAWSPRVAALSDAGMTRRWQEGKSWRGFFEFVRDHCEFKGRISFEWLMSPDNLTRVVRGEFTREGGGR